MSRIRSVFLALAGCEITECARVIANRISSVRCRKKRETRCACIRTLRARTTTLVNFKLQMRKPINSIVDGT